MFTRFLPFWIFLIFFKFAGALHYSLISPFGERLLPLWIVGLLMGGGSVIQFILDVPAGHLMDRFGYRRFLKITTVIFAAATLAYICGLTKTTYVVSLVVATFGWLFFGPGINAYALTHATKTNAGRFMSLRDISGSIGVVLASVVLPFMLVITPQLVGYILFALFIVALVALLYAPQDVKKVHEEVKIESQHFFIKRKSLVAMFKALKRLNPASGMLILTGMAGGAFYGTIWFVVPLVMQAQADEGILGIGLAVFDFSVIVLGFVLGNLADRLNKRLLVFFGLLLFAVAAAFSGMDFGWMFLIFGFLATTGDEMAILSLWAWLHSLDKDHANDGAISGMIGFFEDFGWAVGPIVSGFVYAIIGPTWTIVLAAIPIFATWMVYQYMLHKYPAMTAPHASLPPRPHRRRHRS